jgi:hypothetical protein
MRSRARQATRDSWASATAIATKYPSFKGYRPLADTESVAVDVSFPRTTTLARVAAIPARLLLAGIVAASFVLRFVASLWHTTPLYFPDEYIYSQIARSLAESGRPLIRGDSAHFPAMLEPLLAAPFWLTHDPAVAYRLTQAENALAMSLAAIPVYLLMRRLGGSAGAALAAAALTVASPDLFFSAFVLADAIAYPLVLGAVYLGVCTLSKPTRANQLAFAALALLATFARIQYVFLPVVFVVAALVVERGSVRGVSSRFRLSVLMYAAPVALAAALGPRRLLGYYSGVADLGIRPGEIVNWLGTDAMLLAYAAGFALVPGAVAGLAYALGRPRSCEECGYAALCVGLLVCLFAEAALYATNGSDRFQERYLMVLLPLVFPAFWLWLRRGAPAKHAVALGALGLLALSARVPLSGYTVSDAKQDSPFLLGVFRLEKAVGIGDGSLFIALAAAVLACLAAAVAFRPRLAWAAVGSTFVASCAISIGAVSFDHHVVSTVRATYLPPDARWVDHAGVGDTTLVHTPATPHARTHEQLFWNLSLKRAVFLDQASPVDAFGRPRVKAADDGRLLSGGKALTGPLAISNFAVRVKLAGATVVARGADYDLWRPAGTPRMALFVGGLYHDGWLSPAGYLTLYPGSDGRVEGTLRVPLSLPAQTKRTVLRLTGPGFDRRVALDPGQSRVVTVRVSSRGPWKLRWRSDQTGYLQPDERPVSVQSGTPLFSGNYAGRAAAGPVT